MPDPHPDNFTPRQTTPPPTFPPSTGKTFVLGITGASGAAYAVRPNKDVGTLPATRHFRCGVSMI